MIATMNAEDSELKDVFLDRIGIALNADTEPLSIEERVEAVRKVLTYSEGRMTSEELQELYTKEEQLKAAIVFSREYIKEKYNTEVEEVEEPKEESNVKTIKNKLDEAKIQKQVNYYKKLQELEKERNSYRDLKDGFLSKVMGGFSRFADGSSKGTNTARGDGNESMQFH
jgi:Mg-chelatase subunit ChlI